MTRLSLSLQAISAGFPSPTRISLLQADRQWNMGAPNTLNDALPAALVPSPRPPEYFAPFHSKIHLAELPAIAAWCRAVQRRHMGA